MSKQPLHMPALETRAKDLLVAAIVAAAVSAIVVVWERSLAFRDVEYWAYDFLVNHGGHARTSSDVVIVDFDDSTFEHLRQFPISRRVIASVVRKVAAGDPSVIGLDVLLAEPRDAADDEAMRAALAEAGNVVLASQLAAGGIPGVMPLPTFCEPERPGEASGFCKEREEPAASALGYAFVNLPIESDGFVRRFFLFSTGRSAGISFPAMLAQQHAGEALKPLNRDGASFLGRPIPYAEADDRSVWIGAWSPQPARRVRAIDLLQPDGPTPGDFRGKLVLIGQSHDAARDRFLTPVFRPDPGTGPRRRLSGVDVHAAAAETLLSGRTVRTVARPLAWTLLFLLAATAAFVFLRLNLAGATVAAAAQVVAIYVAAQALFAGPQVWLRYAALFAGTALSIPAALGYRFVRERWLRSAVAREREQIMNLFGRYVSPEVASEIWTRRAEVVLAGEERVATVLFSDIRGFTAATAGRPSTAVLEWLNRYLTAMDDVIRTHRGYLNKFIGDGIMVLFGVPLSDGIEKDAVRALRTALAMLERVDQLNRAAGPAAPFAPLRIGIGLHTGTLTCGNVGSSTRVEYSAIGETVNLASRLESLTKDLHASIVISEATASAVRAEFPELRDLGESEVRGFARRIHLYTIDAGES